MLDEAKMIEWKIVVAFDTDDTLLIPSVAQDSKYKEWSPHYKNIEVFNWYKKCWCYMIVWSWTGTDWAKRWANTFNLEYDEIREKKKYSDIDISIDDCVVDLAKINIKVKRVNNYISRKDWNNTKK